MPETSLAPVGQQMLQFRNLQDVESFANSIAQSQFVPPHFRGKPPDVLAAIVYGMERGLRPMASLQNILVVNGKPAVYGDMMRAMVLSAPDLEQYAEASPEEIKSAECAWVEIKRKGRQAVRRTFSKQDA